MPAPICRVMAEAVVAAAATTTVTVPNAAVEPAAAVLVTATLPTAALVHAVAQLIELVPAAEPAPRLAK